ncbi:MAG: hypothetical protein ABEK59_12890 [Halobacteria archaeon]
MDSKAVYSPSVLDNGGDDTSIAEYSVNNRYALLGNDKDFLDAERYPDIKYLYYPDDDINPEKVVDAVIHAVSYVNSLNDLPRTTYLKIE